MLTLLLPALSLANNLLSDESIGKFSGILDAIVNISTSAHDLHQRLDELNNEIARIVEEGREPTQEEWDRYAKRSSNAHDAIQDA